MTALDLQPRDRIVAGSSRITEPAADKLARLARDYDGRSFLEAIRTGELPPAPIADLLGFTISEQVDDGCDALALTVGCGAASMTVV